MSEINCYGDEEIYGEVLPHWYLVKLVNKKTDKPYLVNGFEMGEGSWGLTYLNDPEFVFDIDPIEDSLMGVPDDCPDEDCPDNPEGYWEMLEHYESRLNGWVYMGFLLIKAAIQVGWNEKEGGLAAFISHKMWECLEKCNWQPKEINKL